MKSKKLIDNFENQKIDLKTISKGGVKIIMTYVNQYSTFFSQSFIDSHLPDGPSPTWGDN